MARRQLNDYKDNNYAHSNGQQNPYSQDNDDPYLENDDNTQDTKAQEAPKGGNGGGEDLINYKGIYFGDDQGQKYTDPDNGAHFEYNDLCKRMNRILAKIEWVCKQPPEAIEAS